LSESTPPSLPLTEATYLILLSLDPTPQHGYAIMKHVEALSDGRVQLSTSTLYSALDRMQSKGLIERIEQQSGDATPGLPRKVYRLTGCGSSALDAELSRLRQLLLAADRSPSLGRAP